jgi:hypothetical protein
VKIILLVLSVFFMVPVLQGQVKKIYAFAQRIEGGAMQDNNAERKDNNKIKSGNERYFVFIEIKKNDAVYFQQVWINGNLYNFKIDTIKKFPLVMESSNGGELILRDTLIRATKERVIQLKDLVISSGAKLPLAIKKTVAANSVVIVYKYKGKELTACSKNPGKLRPLFTQ